MTISPNNIYRLYFGVMAAIAAVLLHRTTLSADWRGEAMLMGGLADALFLSILATLFYLLQRLVRGNSRLSRLNVLFHLSLIALITVAVIISQALFLRTGEYLDLHIVSFFLNNAGDLMGAVGSEAGLDVFAMALMVVAFIGLSVIRLERKSIHHLRNAALVLPVVTLSSCGVFSEPIETLETPLSKNISTLYSGDYKRFNIRQVEWNKRIDSFWNKGILPGIYFGPALGMVEYDAITAGAGFSELYEPPVVVKESLQETPPNIIFVILESVRHDMLGIYSGEDKAHSDTPFLDSLARKGTLVERVYSTIPHTSKALVGIYCGSFPEFSSKVTETMPGNLKLKCLPRLLSEAGYASAHFQTAPEKFENRGQLLKNMGFMHYTSQEDFIDEGWERFEYLGLDDRAMLTPSIEWMQAQKSAEKPFFASLLTVVTHHPYASPGSIKTISTTNEAFDSYLSAVRYTDKFVNELFERLRDSGLLENSVLVITGDHGEAFAEHGQIMHNGVAFEEGMRVPMIIYRHDQPLPKKRITGLRQHIDIMPSVLELAEISYRGVLPGVSLLSNSEGHKEVITSCFYTNYCLNYYTDNGMKLSYYYGKREPELYDLSLDAEETNNLYTENRVEEMEQLLYRAARLKNSFERVYSSSGLN